MDGPSKTAEYMALFRALEFSRGAGAVCRDPLARHFVQRPSLRLLLGLSRFPPIGAGLRAEIDRRWPGARTSGVARTRLIDDLLAQALDHGVEQVVILGAGFDSRAYRLPGIQQARVIEVDHPATLAKKRACLSRAGIAAPPNLTLAEIDFNRQELGQVLKDTGFDDRKSTFFIWEGVTNYLSADAVDSTLRVVAATRPGNRLVFTYVDKSVLSKLDGPMKDSHLSRLLQRAGEPWTFGLEPAAVEEYVAERGLGLIHDAGSVDYRKRYMSQPRDLVGYEFYRIAVVEVAGGKAIFKASAPIQTSAKQALESSHA